LGGEGVLVAEESGLANCSIDRNGRLFVVLLRSARTP
jgi:hypothetical protein